MKIISVDAGITITTLPSGDPAANAAVRDISVVVEHADGTLGSYLVQSRSELDSKVRAYEQWSSELASLKGMVEP